MPIIITAFAIILIVLLLLRRYVRVFIKRYECKNADVNPPEDWANISTYNQVIKEYDAGNLQVAISALSKIDHECASFYDVNISNGLKPKTSHDRSMCVTIGIESGLCLIGGTDGSSFYIHVDSKRCFTYCALSESIVIFASLPCFLYAFENGYSVDGMP